MIVASMRGFGRGMRLLAYALLLLSGVLLAWLVLDLQGVVRPLWWAMCAWLAVGGLLALAGQLLRRWTGEFVGLPLVGSSLVGFSLLQLNLYGWSLEMVPSTALLWSFGLIVLSRWRDVLALYRAAPTRGQSWGH